MTCKSLKSLRRSAERCSPIPPYELPQRLERAAAFVRQAGGAASVAPNVSGVGAGDEALDCQSPRSSVTKAPGFVRTRQITAVPFCHPCSGRSLHERDSQMSVKCSSAKPGDAGRIPSPAATRFDLSVGCDGGLGKRFRPDYQQSCRADLRRTGPPPQRLPPEPPYCPFQARGAPPGHWAWRGCGPTRETVCGTARASRLHWVSSSRRSTARYP